ncbi:MULTISPECIES: SDR family oxidoreductase [Rhodococcus]|uniref:SDR family oxidoreductase n=1 Tax=Rhodococcus sp. APC 3903 TaxID=3035193 RepID=UPI00242F39D7|nr:MULTISPECIES: SDR family oxidoreductase [Rhodococcus]MDN3460292.1 SDR family oxidoreductase [Rhodococcus sp. APC 3903]
MGSHRNAREDRTEADVIRTLLSNIALSPPTRLRSLVPSRGVTLSDKTIVLTGASSGIGEATAHLLARRGAEMILVARGEENLEHVRDEIHRRGGWAHIVPADLSRGEAVDELAETIADRFGSVDILVNNAGRSIRRTALDSVDRFHDYERTMALNYFGPTRLTLRLLPAMLEAKSGHIINVGTWGVTAGVMPRFSAYHASKSALSAFGRSLGAECHGTGVDVTTVQFPLIRTPMIAPTADYVSQPALAADQAASWILRAINTRPVELYPRYAGLLRAIDVVSPSATDALVRRAGI